MKRLTNSSSLSNHPQSEDGVLANLTTSSPSFSVSMTSGIYNKQSQQQQSSSKDNNNDNTGFFAPVTSTSPSSSATNVSIPYLKFADFQRAIVTSCTDPTAIVLVAASPADAIPHCVAHTSLLGFSAVLLNDEVGRLYHHSLANNEKGKTSAKFRNSLPLLVSNGAPNDIIAERSILDLTHIKSLLGVSANPNTSGTSAAAASLALLSEFVLTIIADASKQGNWVILPEVSVLPLSIWTDIGKLLAGANALTAGNNGSGESSSLSDDDDDDDDNGNNNNNNESCSNRGKQNHNSIGKTDQHHHHYRRSEEEEDDFDDEGREGSAASSPLSVQTDTERKLKKTTTTKKMKKKSTKQATPTKHTTDKTTRHQSAVATSAAAAALQQIAEAVSCARKYGIDEYSFSPHFRLITFLTPQSAALGRVLPPKITQSIKVIDTRGSVRTVHDLTAVFSSVLPLSSKQFSLVCIGFGDGRPVDHRERAKQLTEILASNQKTQTNNSNNKNKTSDNPSLLESYAAAEIAADISLINASLGNGINFAASQARKNLATVNSHSLLGLRDRERQRKLQLQQQQQQQQQPHLLPPPSFFVDWPCAAALADAQGVALLSTEPASSAEYVDAALFALRETLLRSLREMISTAQVLDNRFKATRRRVLESRALRTGQDFAELEQIEELRQTHSETHMSRLEKTPGWIFPEIFDWCLGCAPVVNVERIPMIPFEELTFDDIVWVHEGVGDATACLRGSWQLSPVCLKCALPSVRGDVTRELNDKLIVEGRTLLSIRHPAILGVFGICELPSDLSLVQGGNMVLRPLLSAASMHERWLEAQDDTSLRNDTWLNNNNGNDKGLLSNMNKPSRTEFFDSDGNGSSCGATSASIIKQFSLVLEPFEMSLEQLLVDSFDKSRRWTVEQFLDVGVSILRALVHLSEKLVHRCVCPGNVVVCAQQMTPLTMARTDHHQQSHHHHHHHHKTFHDHSDEDELENEQNPKFSPSSPASLTSASAAASAAASKSQTETTTTAKYQYKLSHFSACVPTNRRVAPAWLPETSCAKMPLRYCAPETFYGQFTPASDIWSFGVTMWTILHYCRKQPYEEGREISSAFVAGKVEEEHRRQRGANKKSIKINATSVEPGQGGDDDDDANNCNPFLIVEGKGNIQFGDEKCDVDGGDDDDDTGRSSSSSSLSSVQINDVAGTPTTTPQSVAEGVASGALELLPLPDYVPDFFWTHIISPCVRRRPQDRPDARALISTIMLMKVQHKRSVNDLVEFETPGF